jgi:hypothetical protein
MPTITATTVQPCENPKPPDEAEMAAVAFLARYNGRTLDTYRHDLRNLFQWADDHGLPVLEATRAHRVAVCAPLRRAGLADLNPRANRGDPHTPPEKGQSRTTHPLEATKQPGQAKLGEIDPV